MEYKIASGLDFKEYGGIAYTLNYPNPVDKLRGKTGHGIWIHSKGFGIEPLSTRGCVAIGLDEIGEVGPQLTPGTAVVLAERLDEKSVPRVDDGTARQLRRLMQAWSSAWAARVPVSFSIFMMPRPIQGHARKFRRLPAEQGTAVQYSALHQDLQP